MKNKNKTVMNFVMIMILLGTIAYLLSRPVHKKIVRVPYPVHVAPPIETRVRQPEYRDPPIKTYKPKRVQQMGILVGENEEMLPLYGKEVRGRRDQYHYYTSTPGDQIYSIPVTLNGRDCMDDHGCKEIYGNESVNVLGKAASYQAKLYRTDHFF
jgi:hypothetical protein|tara:strand:- start:271 stop:735 length:465 start_codon:yes stop_codon:yes gene_type:complete